MYSTIKLYFIKNYSLRRLTEFILVFERCFPLTIPVAITFAVKRMLTG